MQTTKKTILIVDDTETNIDILLELLGDEYDLLVALDGQSALEIVEEDSVDLVLLDIMMPNMDGYEVCRRLKSKSSQSDIPVIFLTANTDENSIERAYDSGGVDFVAKPFRFRELLARVKSQFRIRDLIENLEFLASHDEMTGIYNRRKFFSLASEEFEEKKESLYAIMIDIDKFKSINDTYGHAVGDKIIVLLATTIADNIEESSIFGRIGGEEFALLCHAHSQDEIIHKIDSLRDMISKLEILTDDNRVVKFTISEGISQINSDTKNLDELLIESDKALYEAKASGRNRVIFR